MYSHSGATLSKMLECLVNFIAKCKLSEFAIGFCHSKKMYNVTIFFVIWAMSDQNYFCSDICQIYSVVKHCPMSDSNLQPCLWYPYGFKTYLKLFLVILNLTDCDQCDKFIHGPQCVKHILQIVADTAVPARTRSSARYAVKTLPGNLRIAKSGIPNAGKGVFTDVKVPLNTRYGPYQGEKIDFDDIGDMDTSYMWEVYNINQQYIHVVTARFYFPNIDLTRSIRLSVIDQLQTQARIYISVNEEKESRHVFFHKH
jgi:hypothetical protein